VVWRFLDGVFVVMIVKIVDREHQIYSIAKFRYVSIR
jgi:hypothetical protein